MTDGGGEGSRAEQLIAIADRLSHQPVPTKRRRGWVPIAVAIVGVGALVAGIAGLVNSGNGSTGQSAATTVAAPTTAAVATPPTTAVVATAAPTTAPATTAPATTVPASTVPSTTTVALIDPADPVRWAEFSGGKVYLQGRVPDQATADEVSRKAAGVVGADNVVVQYVIDASAPRPNSAPLYVRDSVLFAPNSASIDDAARGVLDLGVALMTQNPSVTIDIHGYTDSDGSPEGNLALSQVRVDEIFYYLVSKGIDAAKLTRTGHGLADPVADNATAEGRAKNRRVEFTINNLLG